LLSPAVIRLFSACLPFLLLAGVANAGIPVPEEFFTAQKVDHVAPDGGGGGGALWTQRYYTYKKHFAGPGHPIFVILGGEGGIPPERGISYPFVGDHLAKTYGAFVLQPEHRFYGKSQPIPRTGGGEWQTTGAKTNTASAAGGVGVGDDAPKNNKQDPRVGLFTSEQALGDAVYLLEHVRSGLGCSAERSSPSYCPVITFGGSYPGFLSAFARILYPEIVDAAYAASAPMKFYAQETHGFAYYDHVTAVAEATLEGCSAAVASVLSEIGDRITSCTTTEELEAVASEVGICDGSIPDYVLSSSSSSAGKSDGFETTTMLDELMMVVGYTFANDNMANYPPGKETRLYKACETFGRKDLSPTEKVREFLTQRLHLQPRGGGRFFLSSNPKPLLRGDDSPQGTTTSCWKMTDQLPTGPNATISGGDWSGDGTGADGESWDFQTCTLLVEAIGFSGETSMFPARNWTIGWMEDHCSKRFGVRPRPYELVNKFGFGEAGLASGNVTRILFTNGLKDGWSVAGFQTNLSDSLVAINFENGAHHSDLSGTGPTPNDSGDIREGFKTITRLLGGWLEEVGFRGGEIVPKTTAQAA